MILLCDECGTAYSPASAEAMRERDGVLIGPCCQTFVDVYPDGWPHPDTYSTVEEDA